MLLEIPKVTMPKPRTASVPLESVSGIRGRKVRFWTEGTTGKQASCNLPRMLACICLSFTLTGIPERFDDRRQSVVSLTLLAPRDSYPWRETLTSSQRLAADEESCADSRVVLCGHCRREISAASPVQTDDTGIVPPLEYGFSRKC